ncbi:hypothetical protein GCM10009528_16060 [Kineococcus aurantiacus]
MARETPEASASAATDSPRAVRTATRVSAREFDRSTVEGVEGVVSVGAVVGGAGFDGAMLDTIVDNMTTIVT